MKPWTHRAWKVTRIMLAMTVRRMGIPTIKTTIEMAAHGI
jgi:hypothetical protein